MLHLLWKQSLFLRELRKQIKVKKNCLEIRLKSTS